MKKIKYFLIISMFILLTGCWDAIELEEQAYVVAIGIDNAQGDYISVTFQIANPQRGSSQIAEAQKEPAFSNITIIAPDRVTAKDLANVSVSRRINFAHLKVIMLSEEYAKNKDKFLEFISSISRDPTMDREVSVLVTKEKVKDFFKKNKPPMETRPHKNYDFMTLRYKDTGLVTLSTINRLLKKMESGEGAFMAIYATSTELKPKEPQLEDDYKPGEVPKKGDNPAQMIGAAVISRGKMIGSLSGAEVRLMLSMWPHAKAKYWLESFPDPVDKTENITTRLLRKESPEIKINTKGKKLKINVTVHVDIEVYNIESHINYVTDLKKQKLLIKSIKENLEKRSMKLIKKAQQEFKVDIFDWSDKGRHKFWTIKQYKKYDWDKKFQQAKVSVDYKVEVRQFGKRMDPTSNKQIEGR